MTPVSKISETDLLVLKEFNFNVKLVEMEAANVALKSELTKEKLQNLIHQIYRKYQISEETKINLQTGEILLQIAEPQKEIEHDVRSIDE